MIEVFNREKKLETEKSLLSRWRWITEDIEDYEDRLNTCIMMENSYKEMVTQGLIENGWLEANILNEDTLNEAPGTTAPNRTGAKLGDNLIPKVMFPIIRRVTPDLIANKLVSVQPLSQPTGVIYYILWEYSNTKGTIKRGDEFSMNANQTDPAFATWYSSDKIGPFAGSFETADLAAATEVACGEGITKFLSKDFTLKRVDVYIKGRGVKATLAPTYDGTLGAYDAAYDKDTGIVHFKAGFFDVAEYKNLDGSVDVKLFVVYDQESTANIPEMEFKIESTTVTTDSRKIKIRWTKESEQDMQAYHKIDVEGELVKVASMQMNYEIDREILSFISDAVPTPLAFMHDWTKDSPVTGNNTQGNFLDRHRALAQKMHQASAVVAQYNRQSSCTWAVVSPQIGALLQMLPDYKDGLSTSSGNTIHEAGQLGGKLDIYIDPNKVGAGANEILMGYKSTNSTYGAGVVYSPYANWMSQTIPNYENFDSVRGFFTRYALNLVPRGEYNYSKIMVDNFNFE